MPLQIAHLGSSKSMPVGQQDHGGVPMPVATVLASRLDFVKPTPPHYALSLSHSYAQVAERKYCRPHARPFRLCFTRVVAVLPVFARLLRSGPSGVRGPVLLPP
jgi:hypothetical protein